MCLMLCAPLDWQYAELPSSASDAVLCSVLVRKMWVIYQNKKNKKIKKSLLIYDVFAGQITEKMKALVEENQYGVVYVPKNMTDEFQPIDLTVNGPAKAFLKEIFETWYANQVTEKFTRSMFRWSYLSLSQSKRAG